MPANPDTGYLGHMASAVTRIAEFVGRVSREDFERQGTLQNALIRELEIPGEAASELSADFVKANPEIPWKEMTGLRHKLIHQRLASPIRDPYGTLPPPGAQHGAHRGRLDP